MIDLLIRIAIILWLALPVIVFVITYSRRARMIRNYPAINTGTVTDITHSVSGNAGSNAIEARIVSYQYTVNGERFMSEDNPPWGRFMKGKQVKVRYDPDHPEASVLWRPGTLSEWLFLSTIWLAPVLGSGSFILYLSFLAVFGMGYILVLRARLSKLTVKEIFGWSGIMILFLCIGSLWFVWGVEYFMKCGFIGQNFMWTIWHHLPLCTQSLQF